MARVLGVRHLVQAGLTAVALRALSRAVPSRWVWARPWMCCTPARWWGWLLVDRGARRVALADTGVELALAAAGGLTAMLASAPRDAGTRLRGGKARVGAPTRACFAPDAEGFLRRF